jgi:hypothetical protein
VFGQELFRQEWRTHCPYCGEPLTLLLDPTDAGSEYTEDCEVCCRPMLVTVLGEDELEAIVRAEQE